MNNNLGKILKQLKRYKVHYFKITNKKNYNTCNLMMNNLYKEYQENKNDLLHNI